MDRNKIVALVMVVVLGVVAWGYVDGWFSPPPENRSVQVSTLDGGPGGVSVRSRRGPRGEEIVEAPAGKNAPKSLLPPARPYQPQGTLTLARPAGEEVPEESEGVEEEGPAEDDPPRPAPRRWFGDPPPLPGRTAPGQPGLLRSSGSGSGLGMDPRPRPVQPMSYSGGQANHWIDEVTDRGRLVELEDGSIWEVHEAHRLVASRFEAADDVRVTSGIASGYPYRISLANGRGAVDARLVKPPTRKGLKGDQEILAVE